MTETRSLPKRGAKRSRSFRLQQSYNGVMSILNKTGRSIESRFYKLQMLNEVVVGWKKRGLRIGLLCLSFLCWGATSARQKEPQRAPFFQGESLPTPPQQSAPWPHGGDALSQAAATLFEQGMADPRGLEYREIEIAIGNPWNGGGYPTRTHGWLLPANGKEERFAVAWDGLVYPVVNVRDVADLRYDWAPDARKPKVDAYAEGVLAFPSISWRGFSSENLKMALLLRLGEVETVKRLAKLVGSDPKVDPYLRLANDWAWSIFERAVCAHQRGDDRLAFADARMLTKLQPLVEAEARRRGFKPEPDNSNSRFPNRTRPYLPFLEQLPILLSDCKRRLTDRKDALRSSSDIAALIDDLQNVDERQWGQPGNVSLANDARVQALVKRGDEAVAPLLNALENDKRLTRSVSFGRDFFRSRHLITVPEAAYAALTDLMRVQFKSYGEDGEPLSNKQLASQVRAYWAKMGKLSPAERFYVTLKDDKAGKDQWLQAAANIVQPSDVEFHSGWTMTPNRKLGQKIALSGEVLRDERQPSVAQLLAKRSDDIAAIRTNSSNDSFLYLDAAQMALYWAKWDRKTAIPVLERRLRRAWKIGAQPNDILAFNGDPVERYGTMIAEMTLALARCGEATAYDEYATWIQKVDLKNASFNAAQLQKPLIQGASRRSIAKAIDYLFNDPKSPWSNLLSQRNGSWLLDFWPTSLPKTTAFRKQALRALANKTFAGNITFTERKNWRSQMEAQIQIPGMSFGFNGSNHDPATPPAGQKRSFRVCDIYAFFYSKYQNGPKIQLFWPQKKRDAAVFECRKWLTRN